MIFLAAFVVIPLAVIVLAVRALIFVESKSLWIRLHQRPATPLRPGLRHLMALIAFIGFACFLDCLGNTDHDRGRVIALGADIFFILEVAGLRVGLRLSPFAWAWWTFLSSVIFILASLVWMLSFVLVP
jgi:hypothetical protein